MLFCCFGSNQAIESHDNSIDPAMAGHDNRCYTPRLRFTHVPGIMASVD